MTDVKTKPFTKREIGNWRSFERVRKGGKWNMFDPRARIASGLDNDEYSFCMKNYQNRP
jgi:hypothetical protein